MGADRRHHRQLEESSATEIPQLRRWIVGARPGQPVHRARWSKLEEIVSTGAATWEGNTVSLGEIDGQLQRLWNSADTEWDGDGPRPDIRTSVLNLIASA